MSYHETSLKTHKILTRYLLPIHFVVSEFKIESKLKRRKQQKKNNFRNLKSTYFQTIIETGAFNLRTSVYLLHNLIPSFADFCISFAHFFLIRGYKADALSILKHCMHSYFKVYVNGGGFKG